MEIKCQSIFRNHGVEGKGGCQAPKSYRDESEYVCMYALYVCMCVFILYNHPRTGVPLSLRPKKISDCQAVSSQDRKQKVGISCLISPQPILPSSAPKPRKPKEASGTHETPALP